MNPAVPISTYRIQLTSEFGFHRCVGVIPYLSELGISTLYCSPVLQAAAGSTHGYDTVDPTRLSTDLGGDEGWAALQEAARKQGMTLLLDIVPNHMAATTANPWWRDVLEYGRLSPYADFFDVDWEPPEHRLRNRILLPLLPAPLRDVVAEGHVSIRLAPSGLVLNCGEMELPLDLRSYRHILMPLVTRPSRVPTDEFVSIVRLVAGLHRVSELPAGALDLQYTLRESTKRSLLRLLVPPQEASEPDGLALADAVRSAAAHISGDVFLRILREQHYVLEHWRTGRDHINYRRFFEVNDLVGVRVEDPRVFAATHDLLQRLLDMETVVGFRVDHVDGLRLPRQYLERLRSLGAAGKTGLSAQAPYIVVEKILSGDEVLPDRWPVQGTTGYDFLNEAAGLFIEPSGLSALQRYFRTITRRQATRERLTYDNQRRVLKESFQPELSRLTRLLLPVAKWLRPACDISSQQLASALIDTSAALPVYRTYYEGRGRLPDSDRSCVEAALQRVRRRTPAHGVKPAREVVLRALTMDLPENTPARVKRSAREHLLRWQQLTSAAMAKGFEDTTLYQDSTLLALNTVGGRERLAATSLEHFHAWSRRRLKDWPHTMNCTATHDTKRGEDLRVRLAVLSEMPDVWSTAVDRWFSSLRRHTTPAVIPGQVDRVTHLFLLQTMVGAWPEEGNLDAFSDRLVDYMVKVAREARTHSSWIEPQEDYERALARLIRFACDGEGAPLFKDCFGAVITSLRYHGLVNSLSQLLLKVTGPGIPDFYQGTELLDLSLVDPDNRRPVDYQLRRRILNRLQGDGGSLKLAAQLVSGWPDQHAKLYVTSRALFFRRAHHELLSKGSYEPLYADGAHRKNVCAFIRRHRGNWVVVAVPLRSMSLTGGNRLPLGADVWGTASLSLPPGYPSRFESVFADAPLTPNHGRLPLSEVFGEFPVALLRGSARRR